MTAMKAPKDWLHIVNGTPCGCGRDQVLQNTNTSQSITATISIDSNPNPGTYPQQDVVTVPAGGRISLGCSCLGDGGMGGPIQSFTYHIVGASFEKFNFDSLNVRQIFWKKITAAHRWASRKGDLDPSIMYVNFMEVEWADKTKAVYSIQSDRFFRSKGDCSIIKVFEATHENRVNAASNVGFEKTDFNGCPNVSFLENKSADKYILVTYVTAVGNQRAKHNILLQPKQKTIVFQDMGSEVCLGVDVATYDSDTITYDEIKDVAS